MSAGDWTNAAGIAPTLITTTNGTASWPDWMTAPIRPIQRAKLDDLQATTAGQRDWLEIVRAKEAARQQDERAERAEREFQVLRKMQATETKLRELEERKRVEQENPIFAEGVRRYARAQAARIAFGEEPAPKPEKPAGPPILPLDTPRRFFED